MTHFHNTAAPGTRRQR